MKPFDEQKVRISEERKANQEKRNTKIIVNSIEPNISHKLYEFHQQDGYFQIFQTDWRATKERIFVNINGKFVERKETTGVKIDILNPFAPVKKISHQIELKQGVGYITALNYENAVRKFKQLNPQFF